jgi:all-trans-retinol dehydrogenase (NAD+)
MTEFAGKNVLVTGGARGLGRLIAERALDRGAQVIIWDMNQELLDQTVSELGPRAFGYHVDITEKERVYAMADRVHEEIGVVDILINNAGIVTGESFLDLPDEMIEKTFEVNALSLFWMTRAFLPQMIQNGGGHVTTIASVAGLVGVEKLADYCASKFAAVGFDESLRVAMKSDKTGVNTTVICPYFIDTGMFDGVKSRFPLLLPILKEEDVADKTVAAIEKNRNKVVLPPIIRLVPLLRMLPTPVFDAIMGLFGVNSSMETFDGHGKKEPNRQKLKDTSEPRGKKLYH